MNFLNVYKHLLPKARAWRLAAGKQITEFFEGLVGLAEDFILFIDLIWLDIFPQTTRELDAWEDQWGLSAGTLTDQERRDRLDATWKALGGQDPRYIQDTLQAAGFNVFLHKWWEPGTEPALGVLTCATPRNPHLYLAESNVNPPAIAACGEALALCGEAVAEAGNTYDPQGFALVNKVGATEPDVEPLAGELVAQCGEADALCGNFVNFTFRQKIYQIPADAGKWPYFLYIGGATFPDQASIPASRRDEFEDLCLKICPLQQWLGILVNFT